MTHTPQTYKRKSKATASRPRSRISKSRGESSGSRRVRFSESTEAGSSRKSYHLWPKNKRPKWMDKHEEVDEDEWKPLSYFGEDQQNRIKFYELMYNHRRLAEYRLIDFDFLTEYKFPIQRWMRQQGWVDLLQATYPIHEFLVQTFYCSYSNYTAIVKSTYISLGTTMEEASELLSVILGIPNEDQDVPQGIENCEVFNLLLKPEFRRLTTINPTIKYMDMLEEFKVLRHILSYVILPKMGGRDAVTVPEARLMYRIARGLKVSLPKLMLGHMSQASTNRVNLVLPYGMWLTRVFEHFELDLTNEPSIALPPTAVIGDKLLKRMHVNLGEVQARFLQDWEQRTKSRHSPPPSTDRPIPPQETAPVPEPASSSSGDVQVFERVDRPSRPGPSSEPGPSKVPSRPPGPASEPGPSSVPGAVAASPPPSSSSSDLSLILKAIRQLSRNQLRLGQRFEYFENQCHTRFDYLDQEIASLRQQAYHPPSPPATHVSYRPHHDRASAGDTFDPFLQPDEPRSPSLHTADFREATYHSSQYYPEAPALAPTPPAPAYPPVPFLAPPALAPDVAPEIPVSAAPAPAAPPPPDHPAATPAASVTSAPHPASPPAHAQPPAAPLTSPP